MSNAFEDFEILKIRDDHKADIKIGNDIFFGCYISSIEGMESLNNNRTITIKLLKEDKSE